ncbi:MAG: lysozyme inhibitor LprI family protein, partial [Ferruginibacter sp.]
LFAQLGSHAQTQLEMHMQAAAAAKKADAAMTAVYKKLMAAQDEKGKKLLLEAQRAWIKYKEAHCTSVANAYEGGSMQPMVYSGCIAELTKARTKELQAMLDDMH